MKRLITLVLSLIISTLCFAANQSALDEAVKSFIQQFENTEGVESHVFVKGEGLDLVKLMLNKEFGKKFMKGVTSIAIMDYSKASEAVCSSIHEKMGVFTSMLEEFDFGQEEDLQENEYIRCFAHENESGSLSDFVIAVEGENGKLFMYMGGEIIVE